MAVGTRAEVAHAGEPPPENPTAQQAQQAGKGVETPSASDGKAPPRVTYKDKSPPSSKPPSGTNRQLATPAPAKKPNLTTNPLWGDRSIEVGNWSPLKQQIAIRGALAVVSVTGAANTDAPGKAGLLVIDAEHGESERTILAPGDFKMAPVGPILDGDYAFFATDDGPKGVVAKVHLDGRYEWIAPMDDAPRFFPLMMDLDGDGAQDIVIISEKLATAWNGINGQRMWSEATDRIGQQTGTGCQAALSADQCHSVSEVINHRVTRDFYATLEGEGLPTCDLSWRGEIVAKPERAAGCSYLLKQWMEQQGVDGESSTFARSSLILSESSSNLPVRALVVGALFDDGAYGAVLNANDPAGARNPAAQDARQDSGGDKTPRSGWTHPFVTHTGFAPNFDITENGKDDVDDGTVFTASAADVQGDGRWDLLIAVEGELAALETNGRGRLYQSQPSDAYRSTFPSSYRLPGRREDDAQRFRPSVEEQPLAAFEKTTSPSVSYTDATGFGIRVLTGSTVRRFATSAVASPASLPEASAPLVPDLVGNSSGWFAHDGLRLFTLQSQPLTLRQLELPPLKEEPARITKLAASRSRIALARGGQLVTCTASGAKCKTVTTRSRPGVVTTVGFAGDELWVGFEDGWLRKYGGEGPTWLGAADARSLGAVSMLSWAGGFMIASGPKGTIAFSVTTDGQLRAVRHQNVTLEEVVRCGTSNTFYALSHGVLLEAASLPADFSRVRGQPSQLRGVACDSGSNDLILLSASQGLLRLRGPLAWDWTWMWPLLAFSGMLGAQYWRSYRVRIARTKQDDPRIRLGIKSDQPLSGFPSGGDLRLQRLVEALARFIDSEDTTPPITIGVYGPWGSGKSSVMRLLQQELEKRRRYISVWFNPWRFHREDDIAAALLQSVVAEVRERAGIGRLTIALKSLFKTKTLWKLGLIVPVFFTLLHIAYYPSRWSWLGANELLKELDLSDVVSELAAQRAGHSLLTLGGIGVVWRFIRRVIKVFDTDPGVLEGESNQEKRVDFLRHFSGELTEVLDALPRAQQVVIFVDDLDRCPPDQVIAMLEALNLLTESQRCYFVLGMDAQMVRTAVELKYEDLLELKRRNGEDTTGFGASYLEKIVTLAVHVPEVTAHQMEHQGPTEAAGGDSTNTRLVENLSYPLQAFWSFCVENPVQTVLAGWLGLCVVAIVLAFTQIAPEPPASDLDDQKVKDAKETATDGDKAKDTATHVAEGSGTSSEGADQKQSSKGTVGKQPADTNKPSTPTVPLYARPTSELKPADPPAPPLTIAKVSVDAPDAAFITSNDVRRVAWIVSIIGSAIAFYLAFVLWQRQRNLGSVEPKFKDSPEFKQELTQYLTHLPRNPRRLIRQGNSARFFYYLLRDPKQPPKGATDDGSNGSAPTALDPATFFIGLLSEQQARPIVGTAVASKELAKHVASHTIPPGLPKPSEDQLQKVFDSWPPPSPVPPAPEQLPDDQLCTELRGWLRDTSV